MKEESINNETVTLTGVKLTDYACSETLNEDEADI